MAYKDFDAFLSAEEAPSFSVGEEKFSCKPPSRVPWKKFSHLLAVAFESSASDNVDRTEEFFDLVLVKEDRERFHKLLNSDGDDDSPVASSDQIAKIVDWLLEIYTGKAEESESPSSEQLSVSGTTANKRSSRTRS